MIKFPYKIYILSVLKGFYKKQTFYWNFKKKKCIFTDNILKFGYNIEKHFFKQWFKRIYTFCYQNTQNSKSRKKVSDVNIPSLTKTNLVFEFLKNLNINR